MKKVAFYSLHKFEKAILENANNGHCALHFFEYRLSAETASLSVIARLMSFQNVLITSHQAFPTDTALTNIADTTVSNLDCFSKNAICENEILIK